MVSLDARYTTFYPLASDLIQKKQVPALNSLAETFFSKEKNNFSPHFIYSVSFTSYTDLKDKSFADLTKLIDTYIKNNLMKQMLSGSILVACLVGAAANAALGFGLLGAALTATLYYYPYDQAMTVMKIKAALRTTENNAATVHAIEEKKAVFKSLDERFDKVSEDFFFNLNRCEAGLSLNREVCNKVLVGITNELIKQNKLVNTKENGLYNVALNIIINYYQSGISRNVPYDQLMQEVSRYITFVTQQHLDSDKIPVLRDISDIVADDSDDDDKGIIPNPVTSGKGIVPAPAAASLLDDKKE